MIANRGKHVHDAGDLRLAYLDHDIAAGDACTVSRSLRRDEADKRPALNGKAICRRNILVHCRGRDADVRVRRLATRDELAGDVHREVDRDREADTSGLRRTHASCGREDGRVDADKSALLIDERATGVAGIDRGVGLNEVGVGGDVVGVLSLRLLRALQRRDDAARDGLVEPEGAAYRHHELSDLQVLRCPKLRGGVRTPVDLENREVGGRIGPDHCRHLVLDTYGHDDAVRTLDNVVVGEYVTIRADQYAGTGAALAERLVPGVVHHRLLQRHADH